MMKALADREQTVAETIDRAEERLAESNELVAEYRNRIAGAENEAQMLIAKARKQADASSDRIIADARAKATATTSEARTYALQQLGPVSSVMALQVRVTASIVMRCSRPLPQCAPRRREKTAPTAGATPHTPVRPQ